ncbi:hypothetical protein TNCV_1660201 [Trichonephila clavipes]|nr:hypothetical protein TNCV_1660201 [Trichonephila clavipes]
MSPGRCNTGLTTPRHAEYQIINLIVRNRCLLLATGRTRDDIKRRIWQGQREKGRNGGEERGGEEKPGREK